MIITIIALLAIGLLAWLIGHSPPPRLATSPPISIPVTAPPASPTVSTPPAEYEAAIGPPPPLEAKPHPTGKAVIALVIDDCGISTAQMTPTAFLPPEVTFSFLPYGHATRSADETAFQAGHDIILHMPMQALGGNNPGPDALTVGLDAKTTQARVTAAFDQVPHAIGMNNHMGSAATADSALMQAIMPVLAERQVFFLDSYTSPRSIAYQVAQAAGLRAARRDIFLDDTITPAAITEQLQRLVKRAKQQGSAIAIGHPHPETLAALHEWLQHLPEQGITLVRVKDLMQRR